MTRKKYNVSDLTGNESLAKSVMSDDFNILLSSGTILRQEYIEKLKELNITEVYVWVEGTESSDILKKELEENFKTEVKNVLEKHTYYNNEELIGLSNTADSIITNILEEEEVVDKIFDIRERSSDIYEHSISTCSLATVVALHMNLPQKLIHDICVGCLLHDLGLLYITLDYTNINVEELEEKDYAEYKKHTIYGYSSLQGENWISNVSKNMILYHHERLDGSGYPLKATDIPLECRIIHVCDAFDEMICGIGCERVKVYEAIEYLKAYKNIKFDAKIVDAFLEFTAVYPAGTYVKTNEGETGVVLRQNKKFPGRPVILIIKDKDGRPVNITKDLLDYNSIYIKEVIG